MLLASVITTAVVAFKVFNTEASSATKYGNSSMKFNKKLLKQVPKKSQNWIGSIRRQLMPPTKGKDA